MSGHDAAIKAMNELFGPIIGITLVLMAVFVPAAFVPGLTGNMFAQFALVIAVTALISAVNAATLKPTQCALWLRTPVPPEKRNFFFRAFNRVYDPMERGYTGFIGTHGRPQRPDGDRRAVVSGARLLGPGAHPDSVHPDRRPGLSAGRAAACPKAPRSAAPPKPRSTRSTRSRTEIPGVERGDRDLRHVGARQQRRPVQRRRRLDHAQAVRRAAQGEGPGPALDLQAPAEGAASRCRTARPSSCRRRRSRASATPAASRCSSSCWAAATTTRSSAI